MTAGDALDHLFAVGKKQSKARGESRHKGTALGRRHGCTSRLVRFIGIKRHKPSPAGGHASGRSGGRHYGGGSAERRCLLDQGLPQGPNVLVVNLSKKYSGLITIPNNPIQIADAALLLGAPAKLGIKNLYELTQSQFNAAVNLLKQQRPLVKAYWNLASNEISLFQKWGNRGRCGLAIPNWPVEGSRARPYQTLSRARGATGWADSWLLAAKAPDPNCVSKWMAISTPQVQAEQAVSYGETPDNSLACPIMDRLAKGSCACATCERTGRNFKSIKSEDPLAQCDNGQSNCVPFQQWATAWTQITG